MVCLLPMYFLTRSKKASSSEVAPDVEVGSKGSGTTGVNVGETAGASGAKGLLLGWPSLARYNGVSISTG